MKATKAKNRRGTQPKPKAGAKAKHKTSGVGNHVHVIEIPLDGRSAREAVQAAIDKMRGKNTSLTNEILPFQDQMGKVLSQMLHKAKAHNCCCAVIKEAARRVDNPDTKAVLELVATAEHKGCMRELADYIRHFGHTKLLQALGITNEQEALKYQEWRKAQGA